MKPSGNLGGKAGQNGMKEEKSTVDTATEYLRISSGPKLGAMGNSQCLCIRCSECSTRADIDHGHKLSRAAPVHTSHTSNIRWCIYICSIPINHKNVLQTSRQLTSNQPWEQFSEARRGIFECPIVKATSSWCGGAKLRHGHGDKNQEHTAYKPLKLVSVNPLGWKFWNLHPRPCQQDRHKGLSIRVQLCWWIKKFYQVPASTETHAIDCTTPTIANDNPKSSKRVKSLLNSSLYPSWAKIARSLRECLLSLAGYFSFTEGMMAGEDGT